MVKLNFGCGFEQILPGWINVDLSVQGPPDVIADLSKDLPFPSACADFIFTESFLEALDLAQGKHFLRECRRILKPTGVMRLLTADLERLARSYIEQPDWLVETWDTTVGVPLATRSACEVMNLGVRMAMQFTYDPRTLRQVAGECGFRVEVSGYNQSGYPELRGLDIRPPERSVSMYFQCYPDK